jgi:hypothetical protein
VWRCSLRHYSDTLLYLSSLYLIRDVVCDIPPVQQRNSTPANAFHVIRPCRSNKQSHEMPVTSRVQRAAPIASDSQMASDLYVADFSVKIRHDERRKDAQKEKKKKPESVRRCPYTATTYTFTTSRGKLAGNGYHHSSTKLCPLSLEQTQSISHIAGLSFSVVRNILPTTTGTVTLKSGRARGELLENEKSITGRENWTAEQSEPNMACYPSFFIPPPPLPHRPRHPLHRRPGHRSRSLPEPHPHPLHHPPRSRPAANQSVFVRHTANSPKSKTLTSGSMPSVFLYSVMTRPPKDAPTLQPQRKT